MNSGTRTTYQYRLNKQFRWNFPESYPYQHTPEGGQRVQRSKRCDNNNKNKGVNQNVNNV